uniref:Uncharacterized protein n=1 Tax=Arundo donax TaxID=35708 RepID=A0A0A9ESX6_ARUDO
MPFTMSTLAEQQVYKSKWTRTTFT